MYKLLLLDIDGTLRDERYGIPDSAKLAIKLCIENHCHVVICTGRSMGTIADDVLLLNVDGYIAGGGSYISYKNKVYCNQSFSNDKINKCLQLLNKENVAFAIESQSKVYMNEKAKKIFIQMNQSKKLLENVNKQFKHEKIIYENNIAQYDGEAIHKLCLWADKEVLNNISNILANDMELAQTDADTSYYEIIQKGYHKGHAVKLLCQKLNIKQEEVISFGDGENDIEMFKASAVGIAMKNSHDKLQMIATSVCEDVMDNGIYNELKRRKII